MDESKLINVIKGKIEQKKLNIERDELLIKQKRLDIERNSLDIKQIKMNKSILEFQLKALKSELNRFPISINKLSYSQMRMIFQNLNILDLFNCKLVSAKWYYIIQMMKLDNLIIVDQDSSLNGRWFDSAERFDSKLSIDISKLNLSEEFVNSSAYLFNLKQLRIDCACDIETESSLVKFINQLTKLEALELFCLNLNQTITLPNLRSIFVEHGPLKNNRIKLNTPKLSAIKSNCHISKFIFIFPEQINKLILLKNDPLVKQFKEFKNWRSKDTWGKTCSFYFLDFFTKFSALNQFIYCSFGASKFDHESSKKLILKLLEQMQSGEFDGLKIVYYGVQIKEEQQLDDFYENNFFEFLMKNFDNLLDDHLAWFIHLNYRDLVKCFTDQKVPNGFYDKFIEIRCVTVNCAVNDQNQLIELLQGFKRLNFLSIENSSLDAKFYNQLSTNVQSIRTLRLNETKKVINSFNFILNFSNLKYFSTNQKVSITTLQRAIDKFDEFKIEFVLKGELFEIEKENATIYLTIDIDDENCKAFNSTKLLVDFLKKN